MKRKLLATGILVSCYLTLVLGGCNNKEVDYGLDSEEEIMQEKSPLELEDVEPWMEEFVVTGANGTATISISSPVIIPDVEQMSVVEVEKINVDEPEEQKRIAQLLYDGTEIYSDTEEDRTKESWQKEIEELEKILQGQQEDLMEAENDGNQEWIESSKEQVTSWQKVITEATEAMKQAPIEPVVVTDFTKESYWGIHQSKPYQLYVGVSFGFAPKSYEGFYSDEFKAEEEVSWIPMYETTAKGGANRCKMTEEEAKEKAKEILMAIGWTEPVWKETQVINWFSYNENYEMHAVTDGYYLEADRGVDEFAFGKFNQDYVLAPGENISDGGTAIVAINDSGFVQIQIQNPVRIVQQEEEVALLPLDTIKGIIRKELTENPEQYLGSGDTTYFTQLELNYARVRDEDREGFYSYIPVWRFCNRTGASQEIVNNPVLVNAMDGSIIELEDLGD